MDRLDGSCGASLGGVTPPCGAKCRRLQPRCAKCWRFARLLPGETRCARCSGVLALEFHTITRAVDAAVRGGW